ncbi:MAG: hypothetical protein Q9226_004588 [Calogaya cf. arnoldii]
MSSSQPVKPSVKPKVSSQATTAQHSLPVADARTAITPGPSRNTEATPPSNSIPFFQEVARHITYGIPWDEFVSQYGVSVARFGTEILSPLLAPLYRTDASGSGDTFFTAAAQAYHHVRKLPLTPAQRLQTRRTEGRELHEYEKMRAKEKWAELKTGWGKEIATMEDDLGDLKKMKMSKMSAEYKSLEEAIKRNEELLARATAKRHEEKRAAKAEWKVRKAKLEGGSADDGDVVLEGGGKAEGGRGGR